MGTSLGSIKRERIRLIKRLAQSPGVSEYERNAWLILARTVQSEPTEQVVAKKITNA